MTERDKGYSPRSFEELYEEFSRLRAIEAEHRQLRALVNFVAEHCPSDSIAATITIRKNACVSGNTWEEIIRLSEVTPRKGAQDEMVDQRYLCPVESGAAPRSGDEPGKDDSQPGDQHKGNPVT